MGSCCWLAWICSYLSKPNENYIHARDSRSIEGRDDNRAAWSHALPLAPVTHSSTTTNTSSCKTSSIKIFIRNISIQQSQTPVVRHAWFRAFKRDSGKRQDEKRNFRHHLEVPERGLSLKVRVEGDAGKRERFWHLGMRAWIHRTMHLKARRSSWKNECQAWSEELQSGGWTCLSRELSRGQWGAISVWYGYSVVGICSSSN